MAPKLGMPVILMPFLMTQNSSRGSRAATIFFRSGGSGRRPSDHLAQSTPGAPWQLAQPRSQNALAPARIVAASSSEVGGVPVACRATEDMRVRLSAQATMPGSGSVAATL